MLYSIYKCELDQIAHDPAGGRSEYKIVEIRPSLIPIYPKQISCLKVGYIKNWLFHLPRILMGNDSYFIYFLVKDGVSVCQCILTPASFRYPFMEPDDLQFGLVYTHPQYRNKKLANILIREVTRKHTDRPRSFWWVTEYNNVGSFKLAERIGFRFYHLAKRSNMLGVSYYRLVKSDEALKYSAITEYPGHKATQEQIERLYHRYNFALQIIGAGKLLEVACGSGLGLKYFAQHCSDVNGIDIDAINVDKAKQICSGVGNITVAQMDAHRLVFPDGSFDTVVLFEAVYYLQDIRGFVAEAHRVLTSGGKLIIGSVNRDWRDFHPSPYTVAYYNVPELNSLLKEVFSSVEMYGAFPTTSDDDKTSLYSVIKRFAVHYNLIPGSLALRAYLKRIFIGKIKPLPDTLSIDMADYVDPVKINGAEPTAAWKILYAVATK